ncbi:FA complementation group M [Haematobia irritans]|uniref:FA complementation group M n=1 Tax=Haematobia irritans TaxID=7368 RepID=UPI003F505DF0
MATGAKEFDPWTDINFDDPHLQNLLDKPLDGIDNTRLRDGEQHRGFDSNVGDSWIYPTNLPCRSYQLSIVQAALYRNTLVVLPTGLGKTFIAAVVMYNLYRWYPRGKVIFMAPTRPLVNQQIEACQKIMPFPRKDTVELTGRLPKAKRIELWKSKRVFFATPQVVQSDIMGSHIADDEEGGTTFDDSTGFQKFEFPFEDIKLIVIDEAHKAKGKYAYTEVTQALAARTKYFRVLALSATPGRTMEDVAEVCRNLLISHVEVRWDTSLDVVPYVHKRSMQTVVVSLGEQIKEIREELLEIIDPYLRQLIDCQMLSGSLANINRNFLVYEQKRYQERSLHNGRHPQHSAISSNFAICISLYHSLELLERHGLRVFLNNFEDDEDGKQKFVLQMDRRLRNMVDRLKEELGPNPFNVSAGPMTNGQIAEMPKDLDFGHPKFEKARECLLKHFEENEESRAIVFCEYRESVLLIYRMLLQHVPKLRPRCFVGQGGTGNLRALTQKQQIQIMNDFRTGKSNILIATSIGEEGIDVGEVDLIVCFDISTSNPTRFVQRIGRTGRKKNGNVVMLVTEGREQQLLKEVLSSKDQTNKKILRSQVIQQALYKHAPRLVPTEFKPKCIQTFVKPYDDDADEDVEQVEDTKQKKTLGSKKSGAKSKTSEKGTQDLRKFFNKKPARELDAEDLEFFEIDTKMTQARPGINTQQKIEKSFDKMKSLFQDLQSPAATQKLPKKIKTKETALQINAKILDEPIDLCDEDSPEILEKVTPKKQLKLESYSQGSIRSFLKDSNEEVKVSRGNDKLPKAIDENYRKLQEFMDTTFTTSQILKRAKINDLAYHLKSKEMSNEMKYLLLTCNLDFLRQNLEQIKLLEALQDLEGDVTEEEKSIKEVHRQILIVFGGMDKLEKYLLDIEMEKFKEETADVNGEFSDDEDEDDAGNMEEIFNEQLNKIFGDLGSPLKSSETFDWVQEKFKQTERYKDWEKVKEESLAGIQQSMVYNTYVDGEEEEQTLNPGDDVSFTESKYCSQWLEFNKPDIAFKSTPLQGSSNKVLNLQGGRTKKTSLLTKLEQVKEENDHEGISTCEDQKEDQSSSSKFLDSLLMCEKELNTLLLERRKDEETKNNIMAEDDDSTSRDTDITTGSLVIPETEYPTTADKPDLTKAPEILSSTLKNPIDHMQQDDEDEDEMFLAALEAEMKFTQTKKDNEEKTKSISPKDSNRIADVNAHDDSAMNLENPNSNLKLTPPSLNSTPELEEFKIPINQPKATSSLPTPPDISLQHELDLDMDAFMEPFPEEEELLKTSHMPAHSLTARRESIKENISKESMARHSPDLFAEDQLKSPNVMGPKKTSLASKLSAKLNLPKSISSINPSTNTFRSPQKTITASMKTTNPISSPTNRLSTETKTQNQKSPSLFDMYLKQGKGRVKLPSSFRNTPSCLGFSSMMDHNSSKQSPSIPPATQNDSIIPVIKRKNPPKRKIFDSDSESESSQNDVTIISAGGKRGGINTDDEDTDFEQEVPVTQTALTSSIHHRRKRRRFNSFIEQEAVVSGSDNSEDEAEHSVGHYLLDSVVVMSDDDDNDQASTSHMQAMYLQSLKSPQNRRGAFKIPAPRVYNDHSHIYSQAVLPEDICSQYVADSFVVDEDESFINNKADVTEVSMCPLERAEKILKERRRAKKNAKLAAAAGQIPNTKKPQQKKRTVHIIGDSSDDDSDDFV